MGILKRIIKNIKEYRPYEKLPNTFGEIRKLDDEILKKFDFYAWLYRVEFFSRNIEIFEDESIFNNTMLDFILKDIRLPRVFNSFYARKIQYIEDFSEYLDNHSLICELTLMEPKTKICVNFKYEYLSRNSYDLFPSIKRYSTKFSPELVDFLKFLRRDGITEEELLNVFMNEKIFLELNFDYIYEKSLILDPQERENCDILNYAIRKLYEFGIDNVMTSAKKYQKEYLNQIEILKTEFRNYCFTKTDYNLENIFIAVENLLLFTADFYRDDLNARENLQEQILEILNLLRNNFLE